MQPLFCEEKLSLQNGALKYLTWSKGLYLLPTTYSSFPNTSQNWKIAVITMGLAPALRSHIRRPNSTAWWLWKLVLCFLYIAAAPNIITNTHTNTQYIQNESNNSNDKIPTQKNWHHVVFQIHNHLYEKWIKWLKWEKIPTQNEYNYSNEQKHQRKNSGATQCLFNSSRFSTSCSLKLSKMLTQKKWRHTIF